jgi:hypothetical protein
LLLFLSRPWYTVRFANCPPPGFGAPCQITVIGSVGGADAHAYLWVTMLSFLVILAILILRDLGVPRPIVDVRLIITE